MEEGIQMNIKRRSLRAAVLSVGLAAALSAGTGMSFASTSGGNGIGSGNQVSVPVKAPVDVCGNAVAVIGHALAECQGGSNVTGGDGVKGAHTSGRHGVLSGNQADVPVKAPVDVCGNGVAAVVGGALAHCEGGASVTGGDGDGVKGAHTSGRHGVLSGNQADVPVKAPVDVCGNAVTAVVGDALAHCPGGASVSGDDYGRTASSATGAATRADNGGTTAPIVGGILPTLPTLPIIGG
ncbi:MAG TPA: chaplin family protein [Mycobacteriales bacterium]|nr:chaplin family protein [Mycobacteriales bacterium]